MRLPNLRMVVQLLRKKAQLRQLPACIEYQRQWTLSSWRTVDLFTQPPAGCRASSSLQTNFPLTNSALQQLRKFADEKGLGELKGAEPETTQEDQDVVADAFERLILEAYKLLQEGDIEKAELLLMEGESLSESAGVHPTPTCGMLSQLIVTCGVCHQVLSLHLQGWSCASPTKGREDFHSQISLNKLHEATWQCRWPPNCCR